MFLTVLVIALVVGAPLGLLVAIEWDLLHGRDSLAAFDDEMAALGRASRTDP